MKMTKKTFLSIAMVFLGLLAGTNTAWANMELPPEAMSYLQTPIYKAQLTGKTSSTGGGKVYITNKDTVPDDYPSFTEGTSNVSTSGLAVTMQGMAVAQVPFWIWAKAEDGYYFAGYSFSNGGVDLGNGELQEAPNAYKYVRKFDTSADKESIEEYTIYGTFEPIRISAYSLSGDNTMSGNATTCTQTVTFTFSGNDIDQADFNTAIIMESKGVDEDAWTPSDLTIEGNSATLVVKFTAPNANAAEYSATLQLKTKANIAINVPLNARKTATGAEALLYDGKTQKEAGITTLDGLLAVDISGYKKPIIKLNDDYTKPVTIDKDITFDLNGYTLSKTITISNGNVTIAYSPYGGSADALSVAGGKTILNGGTFGTLTVGANGTVEQNGATITGTATNNGTLTTTDGVFRSGLTSSGTLTINGGEFEGNVAVDITGGTALVKKGRISGGTYGIRSAGTTTIEKLAVVSGGAYALKKEAGTLTVNNGKFVDPANFAEGSIAFNSGYFQTNNSDMQTVSGKQIWRNTAGAEYRERYEYFAGDYAQAKAAGVSICRIGATSYSSLEDALAYANNTSEKVSIIMLNDYTLPAGHYTLPANATLIVPMSAEQGSETQMVEHEKSYNIPSCYRKLIFSNGVNMNVHGTIEVSGKQLTSDGNFTGSPSGPHGLLQLNQGSKMVLQNNSLLRVWGFVTGNIDAQDAAHNVLSGEIDARRGATVRELFQMGDWKGGMFSGAGLIAGDSIFPLTTYFIQNVEAPVKYHPGSSLIASTTVSAAGAITMSANDIQIIGKTGDVAMFLMDEMADAENTWVRKWYDASKDQQVYEINSGAHVGSLVIPLVSSPLLREVSGLSLTDGGPSIGQMLANMTGASEPVTLPENLVMNSGQYFLPITMNFKLHLLSGEMDFTQSTELLPGSEVEVDKEAKVLISAEDPKDDVKGGSLFIYDIRDWGNYADGEPTRLLQYSPVFGGAPTTRQELKSAAINVHGAFDTRGGYVYTTAHGANIYSSVEDAGTFMFTLAAKPADYKEEIVQYSGSRVGVYCYSAWLNNHPELDEPAESDYVKTGGNAAAGESYCYIDIDGKGGKWTKLKMEGCFVHDEASGIYYAKPQEYVALANGKTADPETHTYSDAAGNLYILMTENCQWWAVEKKDNLYHCTHPENDTYYYWDEAEEQWKEKTFVITWQNYDGTPIKSYKYDVSEGANVEVEYRVTYGTMAEYNGSNPTRPADVDYTYDFTGWSPELGKVTSDVTYTATYEKKQIKYTITFVEDGGMEIEKHLLARDEMPVCENAPTRTGYILQWEPGLGPVVGEQTYTATWLPEPPSTHVITFKNYDGTTLEVQDEAPAGVTPVYGGATPDKPATDEYYYTFTGWKPALAPATTNAIYVAQYSENPVEYTIDFYDENQTKILKSESLPYGATPTPPVVSKENPAANTTYTLVWKTLDEVSGIQTVMGSASYKPTYLEEVNRYTRYTVTLSANKPAGVTLIGAGTYDKGESVTIQAIPASGYEFVQWNDGETNPERVISSIADNITLTAEVRVTAVAEDLEIPATGKITLTENTLKHDLVITSKGTTSGELIGAKYLTLTGDAYFDLAINAQAETWYAVAVPWQVSVADGIFVNGVKQSVNSNFYLLTYNSEDRATNGASSSNWTFENNTCIMQPGTLYMIYMVNGADVIRFKKKDGQILTTSLNVYAHSSANVIDAGWNGIANPALFHAFLNAGATDNYTAPARTNFGQKYIPGDDSYDPIDMKNNKLIVGQPVFVQVEDPKTVVAEANNTGFAAPRRRAPRVDNAYYEVHISAGEAYTDRLYLQTLEDKEDRYVIGLDLAKAGVSNKVAQMWVNRYNAKLCVNTTAPVGKTANYPLGISIPENGTYQISSATEMQANQELYVTRNGNAIWNLAYGPYTVTLDKGTYSEYGIKLIQSNAPAVTTGVDQTQTTNDKQQIQKVIIYNQVYIVRDGALYTITGQKIN